MKVFYGIGVVFLATVITAVLLIVVSSTHSTVSCSSPPSVQKTHRLVVVDQVYLPGNWSLIMVKDTTNGNEYLVCSEGGITKSSTP